jgi:RND family efflux transporter MFP subunit
MSDEQKNNAGEGHHEGPPTDAAPVKKSTLWIMAIVGIVVALLIVITGIVPRLHARRTLRKDTDALAAPTVIVTRPALSKPSQEIVFPSNIEAFVDAPIYARTSGYLKSWNYDIGAKVKKGDLLAVIESPEVDQQLVQARADLQTTQANAQLADVTAARYTDLLKSDSVSKQDTDNAVQQSRAQHASVDSQKANVARLEALVSYERVYAPFDGIVTQRNTDVGQLINAGNGGGATQLFHVAAIQRLRTFVGVPQEYAAECKPGKAAFLTLAEAPNRKFEGMITRTANSIDPTTRTLNVEVDLPNKQGELLPGAYAQVHIPVASAQQTFTLPVGALLFRAEGLRVATVVDNNKAKLVQIIPGRDFGTEIEVLSGLKATDEVITNPPDAVVDGVTVRIVQPKQQGDNDSGGGKQKDNKHKDNKQQEGGK